MYICIYIYIYVCVCVLLFNGSPDMPQSPQNGCDLALMVGVGVCPSLADINVFNGMR